MAGNLGFDVRLVGQACYTFDRHTPDGDLIGAEALHQAHLASLNQEFAKVVSVAEAFV